MSELASPAKSTEGGGGGGGDGADAELPKAMLKRILMARLQEWDAANGGDGTRSFQISKVRSACRGKRCRRIWRCMWRCGWAALHR